MLTPDLLSLISFPNREMRGYQSHPNQVVLLAMPEFDPYSTKRPKSWLVLAMASGNQPAVRVLTAKTGKFSSKTVPKPNPLYLARANANLYPSTRGCRLGCLDPYVPIAHPEFLVAECNVAYRYATFNCKILTLVRHCLV